MLVRDAHREPDHRRYDRPLRRRRAAVSRTDLDRGEWAAVSRDRQRPYRARCGTRRYCDKQTRLSETAGPHARAHLRTRRDVRRAQARKLDRRRAVSVGSVAQIMPLRLLLAGFRERTLASSFVLSCGTVPLLTHGFRFGSKFPPRSAAGRSRPPLTLDYTTTVQERI